MGSKIEIGPQADNIESKCKRVLEKLPEDKNGLVIGSGKNSKEWKDRGWKTLDIEPYSEADYIGDANHLSEIIKPETQDFLYAEGLPNKEIRGLPGVREETLVAKASIILKRGGYLIIQTATNESGNVANGISVQEYLDLLKRNNFTGMVSQSEPISVIDETGNVQGTYRSVVYCAKKL